jgi:type IV pilus assembly protein PilF
MKPFQHIMDKYLLKKRIIITVFALLPAILTGCVTQNYENDDTPVVKNQANRDDMAATRVSLGLGYLKMGNMPQAKQNLEKAKNFAPNMVQVYTAFAHYYETVGEHKLTIESYEKALSIKEDDADTLNNYGVYLCRQDQIEAAEKQFLKAIAVPSYILVAKSYENLSSCFLQQDNFTKAEMYLNKAILHSPSSSSILFQMVQLQYAMGDYKQAKLFTQRFEKYTRRFTSQSLALSYKVYYKLGERGTAKNYGSMLVKMYPQSWESQQYLLNELEVIEADNLAQRFEILQADNTLVTSKKRIVKLSPRKNKPVKIVPELEVQVPDKVAAEKVISELDLIVPEPAPEIVLVEKKTTVKSSTAKRSQDIIEPIEDEVSQVVVTPTIEPIEDEVNQVVVTPTIEPIEDEVSQVVVVPTTDPIEDEISQVVVTPTIEPIEDEISQVVETLTIEPIEDEISQVIETPTIDPIEDEVSQDITEEVTVETSELAKDDEEITENFLDFHIVEAGDTLYAISVKYNIKIKTLLEWNNITKNKKLHIKDIIFLEDPKIGKSIDE